ncbi:MAG: hypothetical protein AAGF11_18705 [Myxococcota bacterium]
MPSAFDSRSKALDYLEGLGGADARDWRAKLTVSTGAAHHSAINLYCNWYYCGKFQLDMLGPALYTDRRADWPESDDIPLTWQQVLDGLNLTYSTIFPWGPWICHDYSAYMLDNWGVTNVSVSESSPTARGWLYWGARAIGVTLWPGTGLLAGGHQVWNWGQDGVRAFGRALAKIGHAESWRWGGLL